MNNKFKDCNLSQLVNILSYKKDIVDFLNKNKILEVDLRFYSTDSVKSLGILEKTKIKEIIDLKKKSLEEDIKEIKKELLKKLQEL